MSESDYSIPMAMPIVDIDAGGAGRVNAVSIPNPEPGPVPFPPEPFPVPVPEVPGLPRLPEPFPREIDPQLHFCAVDLPDGCYRITYRPNLGAGTFRGTMRVDRAEGSPVISGDLYFFPAGSDRPDVPILLDPPLSVGTRLTPHLKRMSIPIYPRGRYHSYLKGTAVRLFSFGGKPCRASITFEQYDYTQPPAGSFNGSFPAAPGSRTITMRFAKTAAPSFLWPGNYYEGEVLQGGVVQGTVALGWVSKSFRKATIEVDTLVDAVAPQAVPALSGSGTESFQTMLASAGWSASVVYDQTAIPKPATVANHKTCWSDADLHALMQSVRKAGTDLDAEWRMHVVVVPGAMGCSRGKMYDSIDVPREGVVSYSDDGYPQSHSSFFGVAQDKMQREIPRAFLRSASHEVVHGFNQIHQESEGGADNSIMTTTPSVADVLATATTGDPGVFPTDIKLAVNTRVRRHLVHFPDPVVRPGGHTFASWTGGGVPSADRWEVGDEHLVLDVEAADPQIALGEPLALSWTLTNTSGADAAVPSEVTTQSTYAHVTVIDATGRRREVAPFVIDCERTRIAPLGPGESLESSQRVFWSTNGFAFERPGRYTVEVRVDWTVAGTPLSVRGETDVFVNYPTSATDNEAAAALLHPEVGKWVALGGGAVHLTEALDRLQRVVDLDGADGAGDGGGGSVSALRGFDGLLPG